MIADTLRDNGRRRRRPRSPGWRERGHRFDLEHVRKVRIVFAAKTPLFPRQGISMSPARQGSGATRIEADLSINRGEMKLMRRASSCLAVLGLAVLALALPGAASAAPTVTVQSCRPCRSRASRTPGTSEDRRPHECRRDHRRGRRTDSQDSVRRDRRFSHRHSQTHTLVSQNSASAAASSGDVRGSCSTQSIWTALAPPFKPPSRPPRPLGTLCRGPAYSAASPESFAKPSIRKASRPPTVPWALSSPDLSTKPCSTPLPAAYPRALGNSFATPATTMQIYKQAKPASRVRARPNFVS